MTKPISYQSRRDFLRISGASVAVLALMQPRGVLSSLTDRDSRAGRRLPPDDLDAKIGSLGIE